MHWLPQLKHKIPPPQADAAKASSVVKVRPNSRLMGGYLHVSLKPRDKTVGHVSNVLTDGRFEPCPTVAFAST